MSVIESIGARYIPIFADPIEWNISNSYERLTIVQHKGDTYVSKKDVPANTAITNENYWILFATFNAQYETLRSRVNTIDNEITSIIGDINSINNDIEAINTISSGELSFINQNAGKYIVKNGVVYLHIHFISVNEETGGNAIVLPAIARPETAINYYAGNGVTLSVAPERTDLLVVRAEAGTLVSADICFIKEQ